ncbi:DnaJ domain-containing protein [Haloarcula amylolytica]|uniref:DnaJ domain-containing protein n=1 Tax=Haloarcula amylolytica TaxID=396317 RepID=UPI000A5F32B6
MVLGVDSGATDADVKEAFREQIKEEHPDQSDSDNADERSKRLIEARDALLSAAGGAGKSRSSRSQQQQTRRSSTSTGSTRDNSDTQSDSKNDNTSTGTNSSSSSTDSVWEDSNTQGDSQSNSTNTETNTSSRSTDSVWEDSNTQSHRSSATQQTASNTTRHDSTRSRSRTQSTSAADSSTQSTTNRSSTTGAANTDTSQSYQTHRTQESSHPLRLLLDELSSLPEEKGVALFFALVNTASVGAIILFALFPDVYPLSELWLHLITLGVYTISSGAVGASLDIREGWSEGLAFLMYPVLMVWGILEVGEQLGDVSGTIVMLALLLFPAIAAVVATGWHILRRRLGTQSGRDGTKT